MRKHQVDEVRRSWVLQFDDEAVEYKKQEAMGFSPGLSLLSTPWGRQLLLQLTLNQVGLYHLPEG